MRTYHLLEGAGPFVSAHLDRLAEANADLKVEALTSSPWKEINLITLIVSTPAPPRSKAEQEPPLYCHRRHADLAPGQQCPACGEE